MEMKNITLVSCGLASQGALACFAKDYLVDLRLAAGGNCSTFRHKPDS